MPWISIGGRLSGVGGRFLAIAVLIASPVLIMCPACLLAAVPLGSSAIRGPAAVFQDDDDAESYGSEEERRQVQIAQRFLGVLEKNPRYGTALDRVYGHHVEFGSLDSFVQSLQQRAEQSNDGADWMLLGMFESQRGNDAAAVAALTSAEQQRPDDALASYYLGQALLRSGESGLAVAAFERAIDRNPARADLLEIFQTLGRVHQRAQRIEAAMSVWQRLEALFPDDPRVLEQIAITLAEENAFEPALARYQKLASLTKDDYRRVTYEIAAAELTIRLKQREEGISQFERILENLNPESWLHRDVRRRIEGVFLRSADQDGLVAYYQRWIEGHPDDVEGMTRLAKFLAASARVPEATEWMERALTLAPSRADLRRAFINQLVEDHRISEALEQYRKLVESAPGNPDYLRDWGKLVLRDRTRPESERQKEAIRIWSRIVEARPTDALTVSQVADLFRQNKISDEAERLYRQAIELAPNDPQYREYLGEFLYLRGDVQEAQSVWSAIAQGDRRTVTNVARLAEVYNSFDLPELAMQEIAAAVALDPQEFSLQVRAAEFFLRAGRSAESLKFIENADRLATNDEQRELVVLQRIEVLQHEDRLDQTADELWAQLTQSPDAAVDDWILLTRYLSAGHRWAEANQAIDQALALQPNSIPALTLAAKIAETSGNYGRASTMYRSLANMDRRSRGEHLMSISRLETQLGRSEEALAAAEELIVSAPGNTEHYEFYAQTCFRFGLHEAGLDALRKAVRIDPNQPHLMMALATALSDQLRTEEAIELYWRAFEKADDVSDKVFLTTKLADLYQQTNQVDKLIERFERDRREEEKRRELTICLAQAWQTLGDFGAARSELESLLSEDSRDTTLLNQLAKLCQDSGDIEAGIVFQRQLVAVAPGHETESPLANMLYASGQVDEARDIFVKLTLHEQDADRQFRSLDALIRQGNFESAIAVLEPLLAQNRDDWELLYREGVCWAELGKRAEAENRFQRLLALRLPLETLGRAAEARLKQAQAKAKSDRLRGIQTHLPQPPSLSGTLRKFYEIRRATGLDRNSGYYYGGNQLPPIWTPESVGDARMAAWGWLLRLEEEESFEVSQRGLSADAEDTDAPDTADTAGSAEPRSIVDPILAAAEQEQATRDQQIEAYMIATLQFDFAQQFRLACRLLDGGGRDEQTLYLQALGNRHRSDERAARAEANASRTPLNEEQLQQLRDLYHSTLATAIDYKNETYSSNQIVYSNDGQAYMLVGGGYVPVSGPVNQVGQVRGSLIAELQLAGKDDEGKELAEAWLTSVSSPNELAGALAWLVKEKQFDELSGHFERWYESVLRELQSLPQTGAIPRGSPQASQSGQSIQANFLALVSPSVQQWMVQLGEDDEYGEVLNVLDKCLIVAESEATWNRRALAGKRGQPSTQNISRSAMIYSPTGGRRQHMDVPLLTEASDYLVCQLLHQVRSVYENTDAESDVLEHLRQRLTAAEQTQDNARQRSFGTYLAIYLWISDEKDEAVEEFSKVVSLTSGDVQMQFALTELLQTLGDFEPALNIVQDIPPSDQKTLQRRELLALGLAERSGNRERAKEAVDRLFGMRLPTDAQIQLVNSLTRLGLHQQADAMLARTQRSAANQLSSQATLMMLLQGQRKHEEAQQLAHVILRRTTSPVSLVSLNAVNPTRRIQTPDSSLRSQAVQILSQTGGLQRLIEQLEAQLSRSPESLMAVQQLIEFHETLGQNDKVLQRLEQAAQVRPENPAVRYRLARALVIASRHAEACDEYLALSVQQPNWILENLTEVRQSFVKAKQEADFFSMLEKINIKASPQPYYVISVATSLIQDEATLDIGLQLLERCMNAFPQYRRYANQLVHNPEIWKNPRVYHLLKRAILPSFSEILSNPWTGADDIYSYSPSGVSIGFERIIANLKGTEYLSDLEQLTRDHVEKAPRWFGGQILLGLLEEANNQSDKCHVRFYELTKDEDIVKVMPLMIRLIIATRLERDPETREIAVQLFEQDFYDRAGTSMLSSSPVGHAIDILIRNRRQEAARTLIMRSLAAQDFSYFNPDSARENRVQNAFWAAQKLRQLGLNLDAAKLYREILSEVAESPTRSGAQTTQSAQFGLKAALSQLSNVDAQVVFDFFFEASDGKNADSPRIRLDVVTPDANRLETQSMHSETLGLLTTILSERKVDQSFNRYLDELQNQHREHLSLATLRALLALQQDDSDAKQYVEKVLRLANANPLEAIPSGRRPNSRQRRVAQERLSLWLLAKRCWLNRELYEMGDQLAELSLVAATRVGSKQQSALLYEWGEAMLRTERPAVAEAKWSELLEHLTRPPGQAKLPKGVESSQRVQPFSGPSAPRFVLDNQWPVRRLPNSSGHQRLGLQSHAALWWQSLLAGSNQSMLWVPASSAIQPKKRTAVDDPVPPLTMSQFRVAMLVARRAAQSGFAELSQRAIRDAFRGGLPIEDPVAATSDTSSTALMGSRQVVVPVGIRVQVSPIVTEVITSVSTIVQLWKKNDYPSQDCYRTLADLIIPPGRADINVFAAASNIWEMEVQSLGEALIDFALAAKVEDELRGELQRRKADPSYVVSGELLEFLLELKSGDHEAALKVLQSIAERQEAGLPSAEAQLSFLAAVRAYEFHEFQTAAMPILDSILRRQLLPDPTTYRLPSLDNQLTTTVIRHLKEHDGEEAVAAYLDSILGARVSHYSRYSGEAVLQMQSLDLAALSNQAAQLGLFSLAFDYLGRASDFPSSSFESIDLRNSVAYCVQKLRELPANERYEKWLEWTMPTAGRQTLRRAFGTTTPTIIPREFFHSDIPFHNQLHEPLIGNFVELVRAAKESDRLEDLHDQLQPLVAAKTPSADLLMALILIEKGPTEEAQSLVASLQASFGERMNEESRTRPRGSLGEADFALLIAAMSSGDLLSDIEPKLPQLKQQYRLVAQGRAVQWFQWYWDRQQPSPPEVTSSTVSKWLAHWSPYPATESLGHVTPEVIAIDDTLISLGGPDQGDVYFAAPMTGNFSVQLEVGNSSYTTEFGYGGAMIAPMQNFVALSSAARHERVLLGRTLRRDSPMLNQLKIDVVDGVATFLLNGHYLYEEAFSATSPWLSFHLEGNSQSVIQNISFSGSPEIPAMIPLVTENLMEGWNCEFFEESQPKHRETRDAEKKSLQQNTSDAMTLTPSTAQPAFSWQAEDSRLIGNPSPGARPGQPSWLYYMRPLAAGDAFEYEFLYDQEHSILHPTIGRMALLLSPDEVRVQWIASQNDKYLIGTVEDFCIPASTESPNTPLPLNVNDWNRVRVALQATQVVVSLNGTPIWQQELAPEQSTRFGLYRTKEQSVQARNLVLLGAWPTTLPHNDDLLALRQPYPAATLKNIASLHDEIGVSARPASVLRRSRNLSEQDALNYLTDWVLPSPSHRNIRLYFARHNHQLDDLLLPPTEPRLAGPPDQVVLHSPAVELTRLAVKLGQADQLRQAIDQLQPTSAAERRKRDVLHALLAIELGDADDIFQSLARVWADVSQPYPKGSWLLDRYWDLLLAWRAGQHPSSWPIASDIARQLLAYERDDEHKSGNPQFGPSLATLLGDIEQYAAALGSTSSADAGSTSSQWSEVAILDPVDRFRGNRPSRWLLFPGGAQHVPGESPSQLYFQSPLTGSFEIVVNRTTSDHQEVHVSWARHDAQPRPDLQAIRVTRDLISSTELGRMVTLPNWGAQVQSRLVVDDSKVETWINGVRLHTETLTTPLDPWIVLQGRAATNSARITNLMILGSPEIPDELNLSDQDRLIGWSASEYGDAIGPELVRTFSQRSFLWQQTEGVIEGLRDSQALSQYRESLLRYQRPMLEDGEIEFETWYEPDTYEVHPAVGRIALILTPDGIKRYQMTDAQFEISGVLANNPEPLVNRPVPLVPNDWNRLRLTLHGDLLRLSINGEEVCETIVTDPSVERHFGLFRFANATQCRVRNVVYRGQWPKQLPTVESQVLARASRPKLDAEANLMVDFSTDATESLPPQLVLLGPEEQRSSTEQGWQLELASAGSETEPPGFEFHESVSGDWQATVSYRDAALAAPESDWGVSLQFSAIFDDPQETRIASSVSIKQDGALGNMTQISRKDPSGNRALVGSQVVYAGGTEGQLRLVRRGGWIECYATEQDSGQFQLLDRVAVGDIPLRKIRCEVRGTVPQAQASVILQNFEILQKISGSGERPVVESER